MGHTGQPLMRHLFRPFPRLFFSRHFQTPRPPKRQKERIGPQLDKHASRNRVSGGTSTRSSSTGWCAREQHRWCTAPRRRRARTCASDGGMHIRGVNACLSRRVGSAGGGHAWVLHDVWYFQADVLRFFRLSFSGLGVASW